MKRMQSQLKGKRAIVVVGVTAALLSAGLVGCGSGTSGSSGSGAASSGEAATTVAQAETPQAKYAVTIDGSRVAKDYEGSSVLVVSYSFTNNSDSDQSFASAVIAKAFQNNVELEGAFMVDGMDSNGYMAEVKPGGTSKVELAYKLADQSDVTVEVEELVDFDDAKLAEATFSVAQ